MWGFLQALTALASQSGKSPQYFTSRTAAAGGDDVVPGRRRLDADVGPEARNGARTAEC